MKCIKVSIIIPVYNVSDMYLRKCIESCIKQKQKNIEIILVDDGSTDCCGMICDEYLKKDKRIRVIHKNNEGVGKARNIGILAARGEYIGFVDADDWIESDFYEKMVYFADSNKLDVVISGYIKEKNSKIMECLETRSTKIFSKEDAKQYLLDRKFFDWSIWDKIYKRTFLIENNIFFDELSIMGEDLDFIWRVFCIDKNIGYTPLKKYHYCYRVDSVVASKNPEKKLSSVAIMKNILDDLNGKNNKLYIRMQELYIKELASCCRDLLIYNNNNYNYERNIKFLQTEIRKNIYALKSNKDFKIKIKVAIMYFVLPYKFCKIFSRLLR